MNLLFSSLKGVTTRKRQLLLIILLVLALFLFCGCSSYVDYFSYVSEHRKNVLLAKVDDYVLRIYSTAREYPYQADGIKRETTDVSEFFFYAPSGENNYVLSFHYDGKTYEGDFSYDSVKCHYYFSCSIDLSQAKALTVNIAQGDEGFSINAVSVLDESTLSGKAIVEKLVENEKELFSSLTKKKEFLGELFVRVLYEERVYYYVGVVARTGEIYAFLMDGTTGKIIAKRHA